MKLILIFVMALPVFSFARDLKIQCASGVVSHHDITVEVRLASGELANLELPFGFVLRDDPNAKPEVGVVQVQSLDLFVSYVPGKVDAVLVGNDASDEPFMKIARLPESRNSVSSAQHGRGYWTPGMVALAINGAASVECEYQFLGFGIF